MLMKDSEMLRFAKNMKKLRETKDISQKNVHRATETDRVYISNLEAGKQNPTLETIGESPKCWVLPFINF